MKLAWRLIILVCVSGCAMAPRARFQFNDKLIASRDGYAWMDAGNVGRADFAIGSNDTGRVDRLAYDDDGDGVADRVYRLGDYDESLLPHVVILLDSLPYSLMADRYARGDFRWLDAPQKMIAPFPSVTELCYTEMFNAPPLPGVIDTQFDPRLGHRRGDLWTRVRGSEQPWERRTHYHAGYAEHGLSFLDPRAWYAAELQRAYDAIERSPDHVTYVYFASAASMVCKYGRAGADEVLDGARKLCLRLLYERRGAVSISMLADHGHNLMPTKNVVLDDTITAGGFHLAKKIEHDDDVVVSINALVTNAAFHTRRPAKLAETLLKNDVVELAIYRDGDRTIVRSRAGAASIETRGGRFRYTPIDADVLDYARVLPSLDKDADGFATERAWLDATADHPWPNGPPRLAAAMTRLVVSVPTVLISVRDGYSTGKPEYERWIKMESTHGGLNQINSATFVMTMASRPRGSILPREVLRWLNPNDAPRVLR